MSLLALVDLDRLDLLAILEDVVSSLTSRLTCRLDPRCRRLVCRWATLLWARLRCLSLILELVQLATPLVTPANVLVCVVLETLSAGVYIGRMLCTELGTAPVFLCNVMVTFTVCPSLCLKVMPRPLVTCANCCLVDVTVLVSAGPLNATFRQLIGIWAREVMSTVTAPSTLERGATDVRRIRRNRGRPLLLLVSTVPTVRTRSPYAPSSNVLSPVLTN